jgi:hypothetical protein
MIDGMGGQQCDANRGSLRARLSQRTDIVLEVREQPIELVCHHEVPAITGELDSGRGASIQILFRAHTLDRAGEVRMRWQPRELLDAHDLELEVKEFGGSGGDGSDHDQKPKRAHCKSDERRGAPDQRGECELQTAWP